MAAYTDKEMESTIGRMLRVGVIVSAAVVLLGGILYLRSPLLAAPDYSHFVASRNALPGVMGVLRGAVHLNGASVIQLGILMLIATPIARVGFCTTGFARQKDGLYVPISAAVLAILIYSLLASER